jgi:hypothetical protein
VERGSMDKFLLTNWAGYNRDLLSGIISVKLLRLPGLNETSQSVWYKDGIITSIKVMVLPGSTINYNKVMHCVITYL